MATFKRNALGRGLDALITMDEVKTEGSSSINEIEISKIKPNPDQPRREFDQERYRNWLHLFENWALYSRYLYVRYQTELIRSLPGSVVTGLLSWPALKPFRLMCVQQRMRR